MADSVPPGMEPLAAAQGGGGELPKPKEKKDRGGKDQGGKKGKKGGGKGTDGKGGGKMFAPPSGPFGHGSLGFRLNVKNFSADTTTETLKALFQPFGTVTGGEVKVREDGKSRGFGFVILQTEEEAKQAMVGMNNKLVDGKPLRVSPAERRVEGDEEDMGMGMGMGKGKGKGQAAGKIPGVDPALLDPAVMQAAMYHHHLMLMQQAQLYNPYLTGGHVPPYLNPYLAGAGGGLDPATGLPAAPGMSDPLGLPLPGLPPGGLAGIPGRPPYLGLPGMPGFPLGMPPMPGYPPLAAEMEDLPMEYEGTLKSINDRSGYGFITCGATYQLYQRDIYVDKELLPAGVKVADRLKFTVVTSSKEHPKASSCRLAGD